MPGSMVKTIPGFTLRIAVKRDRARRCQHVAQAVQPVTDERLAVQVFAVRVGCSCKAAVSSELGSAAVAVVDGGFARR